MNKPFAAILMIAFFIMFTVMKAVITGDSSVTKGDRILISVCKFCQFLTIMGLGIVISYEN